MHDANLCDNAITVDCCIYVYSSLGRDTQKDNYCGLWTSSLQHKNSGIGSGDDDDSGGGVGNKE